LWEEKIRPTPPENVSNYAMEKGNRLEPIAREMFNLMTGYNCQPALLQHPEHEFLKCSLDGIDHDVKIFIEIKYCGKNFQTEVPLKYKAQVQYQSFMTNYKGFYVQINDEKQINVIEIEVNKNYISTILLPKLFNFWQMVIDKSYSIDEELKKDLLKYKKLKKLSDMIGEKMDVLKDKIFNTTPEKFNYAEFSISTTTKSGGVDYASIVKEKLPDLDLSPYKKKDSVFKTIKIK
jgi:predicted phage-related endonuclease